MRALLAASLFPATLALATVASAQSTKGYDFEAAGGAISAGPMQGGAVNAIARYCSGEVPTSARQWFAVVEAWRARNAPWMEAADAVREELFAALRAGGEDPAEVDGLIQPLVQQFIDEQLEMVKAEAERDGVEQACTRFAGVIDDGGADIEQNGYTASVEMLRKHLRRRSP